MGIKAKISRLDNTLDINIMAIHIHIGVDALEHLDDCVIEDVSYSSLMPIVKWVGDCNFDDGTDDTLSILKNRPTYCFSTAEGLHWINKYPCVRKLFEHFDIFHSEAIAVKDVLGIIDEIKSTSTKSEVDKNRAKWLHFWSNKVVEIFGDRARIEITG